MMYCIAKMARDATNRTQKSFIVSKVSPLYPGNPSAALQIQAPPSTDDTVVLVPATPVKESKRPTVDTETALCPGNPLVPAQTQQPVPAQTSSSTIPITSARDPKKPKLQSETAIQKP